MTETPIFDDDFRCQLNELLTWRRDVREFSVEPLPGEIAEKLISAACLAPSVGLSEPWRFVIVEDPARRSALRCNFEEASKDALSGYTGDRAQLYANLKLSGMNTAPLQIAVFADQHTIQGHGLGRQTMPETAAYSVVTAIHTIWITARSEGLGLGWVSILDKTRVNEDLEVSQDWQFIAYLCIGLPTASSSTPALEKSKWEQRGKVPNFIFRR